MGTHIYRAPSPGWVVSVKTSAVAPSETQLGRLTTTPALSAVRCAHPAVLSAVLLVLSAARVPCCALIFAKTDRRRPLLHLLPPCTLYIKAALKNKPVAMARGLKNAAR